jgi:hypothetical protein
MKLTEETTEKLRRLNFDPDAKIIFCLIPLGSITWSDEAPDDDFLSLLKDPDRDKIFRLFTTRINYWNTGKMSEEDRRYWEEAQRQFPNWPLFQRLELSDKERKAHQEVEKETEDFFVGLASDADELQVTTKDKVMTFSATFDLQKKTKRRWWHFW